MCGILCVWAGIMTPTLYLLESFRRSFCSNMQTHQDPLEYPSPLNRQNRSVKADIVSTGYVWGGHREVAVKISRSAMWQSWWCLDKVEVRSAGDDGGAFSRVAQKRQTKPLPNTMRPRLNHTTTPPSTKTTTTLPTKQSRLVVVVVVVEDD